MSDGIPSYREVKGVLRTALVAPMTPTDRIERAARAMYFAQNSIMHDHERHWRNSNQELWRDIAKATITAAFPELFSTPPTHWLAPIEATEAMLEEAYGWFVTDDLSTPEGARRDAGHCWDEMRNAHLKEQAE